VEKRKGRKVGTRKGCRGTIACEAVTVSQNERWLVGMDPLTCERAANVASRLLICVQFLVQSKHDARATVRGATDRDDVYWQLSSDC